MFEFLIKKLKAHPRKIVFTEGTDPRILEASARLCLCCGLSNRTQDAHGGWASTPWSSDSPRPDG